MNTALIVAAGRGTRMGPGADKLFLEVAGLPVVGQTWRRFDSSPSIDFVVLVIRESHRAAFEDLARALGLGKPFQCVTGGAERQDSVWNGLQALPDSTALVAIQDGARPCTSSAVIDATLNAARDVGAAVAAQRVSDTIKESEDGETLSRNLDRSKLWAVQTPQCFRREVIVNALREVRRRNILVTDDTAACELIGQPVRIVPTTEPNPKVTVPSDLPYIEWLLRSEQ